MNGESRNDIEREYWSMFSLIQNEEDVDAWCEDALGALSTLRDPEDPEDPEIKEAHRRFMEGKEIREKEAAKCREEEAKRKEIERKRKLTEFPDYGSW